jgi:hypothetical protein
MDCIGSGNWRAKSSQPSAERIEGARVDLGRLVAAANREGRSVCECPTDTLRLVLYGIVAANAEARGLARDKGLKRLNALAEAGHKGIDLGSLTDTEIDAWIAGSSENVLPGESERG